MTQAGYTVLIVDDDPAMVRLLSRWLVGGGYSVRTASDGREALDKIAADCPDFLITDWIMPGMDGVELCGQLRDMRLPHYVYTVVLTVKTGADDLILGLEGGADEFLTKPISQGELLARMKSGARVLDMTRRLSLLAHTDSLTGLRTQRCFYELLEKEWRRSRRAHLSLSCVMMDLDYFKQINDVCGHAAGDSMLKRVAELLLANCRASDTVCRYGGEEFCIMLPETDEDGAASWAERARERLARLQMPTGGEFVRVSGSFGAAECDNDLQNPERLVAMADQALLCAKRTGRNRVVRYSSLAAPRSLGKSNKHDAHDAHDALFDGRLAGDAMTPLHDCLRENDKIEDAIEYFVRFNSPTAPVTNADGDVTGFVSEKDAMAVLTALECRHRPLSETMRTNVIYYEEDTPLRVIHEFFCRVSLRSVVVTRQGRPVGLINRDHDPAIAPFVDCK